MNVLIVDQDGVGLDFALRCTAAGHEVKSFYQRPIGATSRPRSGDGLIQKVDDWEKWMRWANLIVPTGNWIHLDRLEDYRKLGYPIFGPSKQSAQLEINRQYGMEVFKKHGIEIPPYKMFATIAEAEAYCWKHDARYVFKVLGSEEDKSLTYCARDSADMINRFERWKKTGKTLKGACMLQDFVPGIEFGVSAWMGKNGFLAPLGENFEYKKLMAGEFGQNTGETGSVLQYATKSKLFDQVLKPLEEFLVSIGHAGDIDMNCIIDEKGKPNVLEATCRTGWPAFFIQCSQHEEPCEWMADALQGRDTLKVSNEVFTGIVMAQPPWPNKGAVQDQIVGTPILGITEDNWDSLHPADCMMGKGVEMVDGVAVKKDMIVTSGTYVMCVTGSGATVRKACRRAYATVDEIHIPDAIVRDDVGENLQQSLPVLHGHGYATAMEH